MEFFNNPFVFNNILGSTCPKNCNAFIPKHLLGSSPLLYKGPQRENRSFWEANPQAIKAASHGIRVSALTFRILRSASRVPGGAWASRPASHAQIASLTYIASQSRGKIVRRGAGRGGAGRPGPLGAISASQGFPAAHPAR